MLSTNCYNTESTTRGSKTGGNTPKKQELRTKERKNAEKLLAYTCLSRWQVNGSDQPLLPHKGAVSWKVCLETRFSLKEEPAEAF